MWKPAWSLSFNSPHGEQWLLTADPPQCRPKASSQEEPNRTENHSLFDLKT